MASITSNKGTCEHVPKNLVTANKITPKKGFDCGWVWAQGLKDLGETSSDIKACTGMS
jgi:hypothetical protein